MAYPEHQHPARAGVDSELRLRSPEPWTREALEQFLEDSTVVERACLRLLAWYGALDRRQLEELLGLETGLPDFDSRNLAACTAQINRKVGVAKREPLLWSTGNRHSVNAKWLSLLRECL